VVEVRSCRLRNERCNCLRLRTRCEKRTGRDRRRTYDLRLVTTRLHCDARNWLSFQRLVHANTNPLRCQCASLFISRSFRLLFNAYKIWTIMKPSNLATKMHAIETCHIRCRIYDMLASQNSSIILTLFKSCSFNEIGFQNRRTFRQ
jgi:hypothetical protein